MNYTAHQSVHAYLDTLDHVGVPVAPSITRPETASMMSFAVAKRPRTTRAKFPKVRTGCVTCKKRHVKCDETKPSCTRCIKWRGTCSGYEHSFDRSSSTPEPTISTLGRSASASEVHGASSRLLYSPRGSIPRARSLPPTSESILEGVSPQISPSSPAATESSAFDPTFWSDIVPRLVEECAAVRSANEAVHILILAKQPSLMSLDANPAEDHYGGALRRYGAALREVRQETVRKGDLRSAILCSMFFVIFEIINGDQKAAEAHLFNGQRMMDELHHSGSADTEAESSQPKKSLRKELKYVLRFLALQARSHGVVRWEREMRNQSEYFADSLEEHGAGASC